VGCAAASGEGSQHTLKPVGQCLGQASTSGVAMLLGHAQGMQVQLRCSPRLWSARCRNPIAACPGCAGITILDGDCHVDVAANTTLKLLHLLGHDDIPVGVSTLQVCGIEGESCIGEARSPLVLVHA
jgi:hypothetical protein